MTTGMTDITPRMAPYYEYHLLLRSFKEDMLAHNVALASGWARRLYLADFPGDTDTTISIQSLDIKDYDGILQEIHEVLKVEVGR